MVKVSEIAKYLKKKYIGKNISIKIPASFDNIKKNSIIFLNKNNKKIISNDNIVRNNDIVIYNRISSN